MVWKVRVFITFSRAGMCMQRSTAGPVSMQDEAFGLWTSEWGSLYEEGSRSRQVIHEIASTWYLVSVVDNDFVHGDLFSVLKAVEAVKAVQSNGAAAHA